VLTTLDLEKVGNLFNRLGDLTQSGGESRLNLAIKRLNSSALRTNDEDGIIDSAIALEALLADGNVEMTYKVSLRAAALAGLRPLAVPTRVLDEMKQIYAFRSAVVHGSVSDMQKRKVLTRDGEKLPTAQVALEHLRTVLMVVAENPKYLDVKAIDTDLLLG
jgi:hypothetical protein